MLSVVTYPVGRTVYMETFGEVLRRLRTERGETLESLAEKTTLTYVAIGDWERGKRNPRRVNIELVAEALGVDPHEMLTAAGFLPIVEMTREPDEDVAYVMAAYSGLDQPDKEIAKRMIDALRKSDKKKSIGGRGK